MSGGKYDYAYRQIEMLADNISYKGDCSAASETLRKKFVEHLKLVAEVARAIEWNDSGDGDSEEVELILRCLKLSENDFCPEASSKTCKLATACVS